MKPMLFDETNCTFAASQPEYLPLPCYKSKDGEVISLWKLDWKERVKLLFTGKLWIGILTFNKPLQPIMPSTDSPFVTLKKETF